ncbi:MAG: hypothetical protein PWR27_1655 [Petroclostridium sp.]|nr:hypothetical protein [Petroclostridium sp.]
MINFFRKYKLLPIQTKASIAYTFASLVSKGINIITIPIFTRLMTTYEVGIGATYTSWYNILYSIVTLSLCSGSLNIAMMDYKNQRGAYQSACLTLSTISGGVFVFIYLIFEKQFHKIFMLDSPVMLILIISLIINPALDFWYTRQRYEYKYFSSVIVTILVAVLPAIVSVLCVIVAKSNDATNLGNIKVLSQNIIIIGISLVFYIILMVKGRCYINISMWKYALQLSIPLIIHGLAKNVLDVSDRLMISYMCGKSYAGIYGSIYSLSMISLILWNAINASLIPVTFEKLERKQYRELNRMLYPVILFFGITSVVVTLFAPEILAIFTTKEYYSAVYLVPALCAGIFFSSLYNIYGNMLLFKKKTVNIMFASIVAALVNIGLNFAFIRIFGYMSAAYTTLLSFILLAIGQGIMVRVVYKKKIIRDELFFLLAMIITVACLVCNLLYNYMFLRFFVIFIILVSLFANRKKILDFKNKYI